MTADLDRKTFLGGSDMPALLGISPWKTPLRLWAEKTGSLIDEPQPDERRRKLFERGKRWEPIALEMLVDELTERGHEVEVLARNRRVIDTEHEFLAAEIDADLKIDGVEHNGEMKTTTVIAARQYWGDADTDEIPMPYLAQAQHGMGLTGRAHCVVGCLIGADEMKPYVVTREDAVIATLRARAVAFWHNHVLPRIPPEPTNLADVSLLAARLKGVPVELTEAALDLLARLRDIRAARKIIEAEEDSIRESLLRLALPVWQARPDNTPDKENAAFMYAGKVIATYNAQSSSRLDISRLRRELPDIATRYTVSSTSRVLRLK